MFNNSYKIMFLLILMLGTLMTISSNSWMSAWMGLEINLLSFIPLMNNNNLMSTESSLKYFLTQALASTVFLFTSIFYLLETFYMFNLTFEINLIKMLILSSLMLKTGVAPFHFWFPSVSQGLSWMNLLLLMTWQKIAPMMIMSYVIYKPMIMICAILSAIFGMIGGLNQTSLNKLMAYSSINHLSWMLMAILKNESIWMMYFLIYSFLSMTMVLLFHIFNIFHINQLFMLSFKSKTFKFITFFNLLSLGGLPPFLGFLPKWMVIQSLIMSNQFIMMTILIISSLVTLFFYLRLGYTAFMLNFEKMNFLIYFNSNKKMMYIYLICSSFSLLGLFLISIVYFIF